MTDQAAGEPFQGECLAQERTGLTHSLLCGTRKTVLCSCLPAPAPLRLQVLVVLVVIFSHAGVMSKLISLHSLSLQKPCKRLGPHAASVLIIVSLMS